MEITLKKSAEVDLVSKLREITNMCKISKLNDMMYNFFDNMSSGILKFIKNKLVPLKKA